MRYILYFILIPALLPVFLIFKYIYGLDKVEREPIRFVLKVLLWGAIFSIPCAVIERFAISFIQGIYDPETIKYAFMENTFGVALVEEFSKWLVLMILVWKNNNFDYRYDGIVYATTASLGFAALENILYVVNFGTGVSIGRAIFAIPGHTTFGVFMGFFLSRAKTQDLDQKSFGKTILLILSLAVSTVIHGCYDFLLSDQVSAAGYQWFFYIFVALLDFFAWRIIHHEFKTDHRL
ncbi:MAG: PrsW family intramembrane metalloprotease [Treponema sp.]|nr:PrsW family intramembrane metalloprotease [Treponema sp.]